MGNWNPHFEWVCAHSLSRDKAPNKFIEKLKGPPCKQMRWGEIPSDDGQDWWPLNPKCIEKHAYNLGQNAKKIDKIC